MLRTRSKGTISGPVSYATYHYPDSCANRVTVLAATGNANVVTWGVGERIVTIDEVNKGYWKRKKAGDIIINYFLSTKQERKASGGSGVIQTSLVDACVGPNTKDIYTHTGNYGICCYAAWGPTLSSISASSTNEVSRLHTEVVTKSLAGRQSGDANYFESLAELDKTFSMLHAPLENVSTFVKGVRSNYKRAKYHQGRNHSAKEVVVLASSEWLRFRYGITPLISDVKAGLKAWRKKYDQVRPSLHKSRANGSLSVSGSWSGTFNVSTLFKLAYTQNDTRQISKRAIFYDKYVPSIFQDLGLTFQNLVVLPWELTRYSFVVDWFANVGDLMYANVPRIGVTPCGGSITTRTVDTTLLGVTTCTDINSGDGWVFTGSCGDTYSKVDTVTERVGFGVGDSGLVLKSDFRLDHFTRAADAMALISQVLSRISFERH